ncbi:LOW QUALITY PROTEIN: serum response factor-binding protein 1-like [Pecten maximus]|uniref:LOW QUALITY PROTEIN: serum response factor-binding protein 1-like n=1 Tax=Pecten maximus TaxID=6579 RepID=UPI0014586B9D|nr:LOW QUALITY PROTEIN: serum response factor-binding protein 1-like [Pecten maximus]
MAEHEDDISHGDDTRTLDNALKASIDMVALNNKVVCMRSTVKKAKIYTIRKLKNRLRQLKDRKGSPEEIAKDQRRLKKFRQELHVIRHLKKDLISKYALGCTDTVHELCKKQNDVDVEIRALTRLAEHKLMQLSIKRFREEHEDWKSLAAFLLTKQSGRRIKKQRGQTPIEKMITNVTTGQLMVKTYLQDKLERNVDIPKDKNIKKKKKITEEDRVSESETESSISKSNIVSVDTEQVDNNSSKTTKKSSVKGSKTKKTKVKESLSPVDKKKNKKQGIEVVEFNSKEIDGSECFPSLLEDSKQKRDLVSELRGISDEESNSEMEDNEDTRSDTSYEQDSDETSSVGISSPKKSVEKVCGEMVVKKLELDDDVVDESFMTNQNVNVFNDQTSTTTKLKRKKASDSFFVKNDSGSEDAGTGNEEDDGNEDEDSGDVNDELNEPVGNPASKGKTALRSTFMYSLSDSKKKSKTPGGRGKTWEGSGRGGKSWGRNEEMGNVQRKSDTTWKLPRRDERWLYGGNRGRGFDRNRGRGGFDGNTGRGKFDRNSGQGRFDGNRGWGGLDKNRGQGQSFDRQGGHDWKSGQKGFSPKHGTSKSIPEKPADEGPLHPSWQASKKRKEQGGIQAFQGKKIKFDD